MSIQTSNPHTYLKTVGSGFNEVMGCTTTWDYSQKYCALCGQTHYGTHICPWRGVNVTPTDYIPELGRQLSQIPCGERQKDGPVTGTLAKGHDGPHCAPVKWDSWK